MTEMSMMLWYDCSGLTAEEKIAQAKSYYTNKTGQVPNVCKVDLGMIAEEKEIAGMRVIPDRRVMRHYLWLGREESPAAPPSVPPQNTSNFGEGRKIEEAEV